MPELPEVETVRRGLAPALTGRRIARVDLRRPDLRFPFPPDFAMRIEGRRIEELGRRAKYLLLHLEGGLSLVVHLGMSGSLRVEEAIAGADSFHYERAKDPRHDHVIMNLDDGKSMTYNDPRRFGFMNLVARDEMDASPMFRDLGPEPMGAAFDAACLARALAGRQTPLKAALLDQRVVAGLGNIYVCEALNRARLSPQRIAATLARRDGTAGQRAERLVHAVKEVLAEAIEAGGSSLRDYVRSDGTLGMFQHAFRVYDRLDAPCPTPGCRGTVRRIVQAGRSTFYCPECQR
ncbi:bifunctional DNA-formamidopyrimidine glycosylase/DNA-(apurinic or apyrimidinic site) lyase [Lutibaculum baratangense]|uniref:Formamidopyrimidine-DNA glycosylase n=1 Tax=Lutibaculum baratangense AMV1 TaxID=631454 RepID=V4RKJ3_9HYPH|nr:bifunctional DNA-formamidopyrimidine glycosylase/DNA-(apurinic or apyrimidinic site) lyase [Lutibaculum baratangense]ESR25844.1 Formamidopyrimidine-DNA glycosylase [Lutibaculum baratangense AMV1]